MAYPLWQRIEDERLRRGWTKSRLAEAAKKPRSTFNDLKNATRPPLPATVHAYADAVELDRTEAEQLAGLRPAGPGQASGVREALEADDLLTPSNRRTMIELYEQLTETHRARMSPPRRSTPFEDHRSDDARRAI